MRLASIILLTAMLTACASPTQNIDVKNSPCACLPYIGEPLNTTPTEQQIKELETEWFVEVLG